MFDSFDKMRTTFTVEWLEMKAYKRAKKSSIKAMVFPFYFGGVFLSTTIFMFDLFIVNHSSAKLSDSNSSINLESSCWKYCFGEYPIIQIFVDALDQFDICTLMHTTHNQLPKAFLPKIKKNSLIPHMVISSDFRISV